MSKLNRKPRAMNLESLESRNLLTLIGGKPTLHILEGPGVHNLPRGRVNILQPAEIQVYGTAQPATPGTTTTVRIYAEDRNGNIINNGNPLAVTTPDALGRYGTVVALPSTIRRDVNFLVARQDATATEVSQLSINGTTFTSTSGTLTNGTGTLAAQSGTLAGGTGTLAAQTSTLSGGSGTIAASTSQLVNGGGTINASTGLFTQTGVVTLGGGGIGTIAGLTGTVTTPITGITGINGTVNNPASAVTGIGGTVITPITGISGISGAISTGATPVTGITGTVAVSGTIAPTTGTSTRVINEASVSDPVTVLIHQPRGGVFVPLVAPRIHAHARHK